MQHSDLDFAEKSKKIVSMNSVCNSILFINFPYYCGAISCHSKLINFG